MPLRADQLWFAPPTLPTRAACRLNGAIACSEPVPDASSSPLACSCTAEKPLTILSPAPSVMPAALTTSAPPCPGAAFDAAPLPDVFVNVTWPAVTCAAAALPSAAEWPVIAPPSTTRFFSAALPICAEPKTSMPP